MAGLKGITVNTVPEAEPHIYAEDDAAIFQAMFGEDGVSSIGQACKATVLSNNKVRIADGVLCVGGHFARIPYGEYVDCEIANGQSGKNRNDIIVAKFVTTGSGGIDTMTCEVKQGVTGTTATDPTLTQNDIYKGGKIRELPLYRVKLEGLNITAVEQLFTVNPTNKDLSNKLTELNGKTFNKQLSATGLTARSNRCSIQSGGYFVIGNMCYFQLKVKILTALAGPNYWSLIDGLPRPIIDKVAAVASNDAAGGAARTVTVEQTTGTNYGNLVYHNQANASVNDVINFSGFYMIAT